MSKILVAYYSRAGENYFGGSLKVINKGNTEYAAEIIACSRAVSCLKSTIKSPIPTITTSV